MPYISIVIPISRPKAIELVCEQLEKIVPLESDHIFELVVALDNNRMSRFNAEIAFHKLRLPFRNVTVFSTGRPHPNRYNVPMRRDRIAKTLNEMKEHIGGSQFIFGFEDDTILPDGAIESLLKTWGDADTNVGMVEGVQVGRWGVPYIGAWIVDDVGRPTTLRTLGIGERTKKPAEIDAGGFYCFLTPTTLFKEIEHKWEEPTGPDVNYGLELRRRDYHNYLDWNVETGHKDGDNVLWPGPGIGAVELYAEGGRWKNKVKRNGE